MQISRRDLYNRVWTTPMSKLARELDISDVGLAKACRRYNIPRPPRGYWAKLAAGKASAKPGLPPAKIDTVEFDAARHRIPTPPKVEVDPASIKVAVASSGEDLAGITAATYERLSNAKPSADGFVSCGSSRVLSCSLSPATVARACRILDAVERAFPSVGARFVHDQEKKLVDIDTGKLLVVRVHEGDSKPYGTAAGLFKQRVGKNCMPLDPVTFQRAQVRSAAVDWSGAPANGLALQDLDPLQIERARQVLRSKAPSSGLLELPDPAFLSGLEALREGQVTHAGMLLFARREVLAQRCPQAQFHYVLHDGETSVARNDIDRLPLLEAVERMEQVFTGPLNPEKEIELGLFKLRIPQFPVEGVREAVLNALTHRDYLNPGEILVRHSTQELVVTSPGGFVAGITPENILRHEAVPRNRTLANALVKLRLVESSGIGRRRIFRSALVFGKRRPEYVTDGHSVTLRMFNREAHDALAKLIARLDAQGAEVALDQLLVLDALLGQDFIDVTRAANVLQLGKEDSRRVLDAMCLPPMGLLERRGHTAAATFHLAKGVAKELKGKAAYTRTRGLNPIRYAEMVREYLRDHQRIENAELRELLGLGNSPSAQVEASRYLKRWSQPDGFLDRQRVGGTYVYTHRARA